MEPLWILYRCIWALNLLATALVIWRLFHLGLNKTYRFFLASMAIGLLRSLALFPFSPRSQPYYQIWVWTQPILWLFQVLVVFELYALVLRQYRGLYTVGRVFLFGAIAASALFSALTVLPTRVASPSDSTESCLAKGSAQFDKTSVRVAYCLYTVANRRTWSC